jgi:hypothetical protein
MFALLLIAGCTIQFLPEVDENKELLVVEGLLTDQNRTNAIKLSRSLPLGKPLVRKPVRAAVVTITDDKGSITTLKENLPGIYMTDSTKFRGKVGSRYSLTITIKNVTYSTDYIEMKPVPPINTLGYEKVVITASDEEMYVEEGCKIILDSYDPTGKCLYYRWDYVETYEYTVPYEVINKVCWVTERSDRILIKNTSIYNQARVSKYPVTFITNKSDKLKERYSIQVSQYSLNEPEFDFWERVQNISQNIGGLHDITPMAIPSNIRCNTFPEEQVLGYFSVSAVSQKRLFIKERFLGLPNFYSYCATDTLSGRLPETGLNTDYWVIEDYGNEVPPFYIITTYRECADCTTRGTTVRPDFWLEYLNQTK